MALERVHSASRYQHEEYRPVRLGPQDLRDIAAVFAELDVRVPPRLPVFRTTFRTEEHETKDVEDVLAYADVDTIPSLHVLSADLHLTIHLTKTGTTISKFKRLDVEDDRRAVEDAAEKLREIVRSRELTRAAALRQTGPDKWGLLALLLGPIAVSLAAVVLLGEWMSAAAANAAAWGVLWLCYVPLLAFSGRSHDLIRLRGQDQPWWERRVGLITLAGVAAAVVVPLAIYGLDGLRG